MSAPHQHKNTTVLFFMIQRQNHLIIMPGVSSKILIHLHFLTQNVVSGFFVMFDVVVMFDSAVVVAFNIPIKIKLCMLSLLDYLHDCMILSPI